MTKSDPDARDAGSLSIDQARRTMLDAVSPVTGWESVGLREALGRVLDRDVVAPFDVPAHDNCAMDGFAVRAADVAGGRASLTVVGSALAGRVFSDSVGAGQAVRVMTGAVLPRDADTVVVQESARVDGDAVVVLAAVRAEQNVRRAGEDLARGKPALRAGQRLGPPRSACWLHSVSAKCRCAAACAWRSFPPATKLPPSDARWRRAKSTTATATRFTAH